MSRLPKTCIADHRATHIASRGALVFLAVAWISVLTALPSPGVAQETEPPLPSAEASTTEREPGKKRDLLRTAREYLRALHESDWRAAADYLDANSHYQDFSMEYFERQAIDLRGAEAILDFWRTAAEGAETIEVGFEVEKSFVAGPNVFFIGRGKVKNRGEAWGVPGKILDFDFTQISHVRMSGGKVTYHADHVDYAEAFTQLEAQRTAADSGQGVEPESESE